MSRQITKLKNLYACLGIARTAKQSDIKKAYYDLSKECHPDRNEGSARAAERFHRITEAYKVLGNETSRREYDKSEVQPIFSSVQCRLRFVFKVRHMTAVLR